MNDILNTYDIDDMFLLEGINGSKEEIGINSSVMTVETLIELHHESKFLFPSYFLRYYTYNDLKNQSFDILDILIESGSIKAYEELKSRPSTNLSKVSEEFLVLGAQKLGREERNVLTDIYEPIIDKMIDKVERKYYFKGLERDDLIQEAFLGFLKAVEVYKIERRTKFRDFCYWVIQRHLGTLLNRSKNYRNRALNKSYSYDMPVNSNNKTTFEDLLEGDPILPEDIYIKKETYYEIKEKLTENEQEVLEFYALRLTYDEIAFEILKKNKVIDFDGKDYDYVSKETKKNQAIFATKGQSVEEVARILIEQKSPFAENMTFDDLVSDVRRNLEYMNKDGLTYKEIAIEMKKKKKSVDNTVQRIRKKGEEHIKESLAVY